MKRETIQGQLDRMYKMKALMCMKPILHCPDGFLLQSEKGIGAVLSQMTEEGVERPVAFSPVSYYCSERHAIQLWTLN